MKITSRTDDSATIADLETRLESLATYVVNQDMENMRLQQRLVNLELIVAKMQHTLQGQVSYAAPAVPKGVTIQNGQIYISTQP